MFAQELIHGIVSNFDTNDEEDLRALTRCSLVSHSFLAASRQVLFWEICLSNEIRPYGFRARCFRKRSVINAFLGALSSAADIPSLAPMIHRIYLDCGTVQGDRFKELLGVLQRLTNLEDLLLFGAKYPADYHHALGSYGAAFPSLRRLSYSCYAPPT
jgi:hypothetical protein